MAERGAIDYAAVAKQLGMNEGAARVAVHRLRKHSRDISRVKPRRHWPTVLIWTPNCVIWPPRSPANKMRPSEGGGGGVPCNKQSPTGKCRA